MLPATLGGVGEWAFRGLSSLLVVYVRCGHDSGLRQWLSESVQVLVVPSRRTPVGAMQLWQARALKNVALPQGAEGV